MRVAHIITRLILGGAQENTIATVLGLRQIPEVEVQVYSGPSHGPEGSLEARVGSIPGLLTVLPRLVRPIRPIDDWLALRELERSFRSWRPDVVHTHSGKAGILGRLAARRARVPLVIHGIHGPSFGPFQGAAMNWLLRGAERYAARCTNHFIVVAEAMTRQYLAAGIGRAEQFTCIRSGFDLGPYLQAENRTELRDKLGLRSDAIVIGTLARLFALKGHDELLEVAPRLVRANPRIQFLWVGDGSWRERLENKVDRLGLRSFVKFAGLVSPNEVPAYVGIMDILAHLSRREGLARALPQAMAAGKPVVAWDCDGAGEVCFDGKTGFLIPVGQLDLLSERLVELAQNPALRARLGGAGRALVKEEFPEQLMVRRTYELYLRLLQSDGSWNFPKP